MHRCTTSPPALPSGSRVGCRLRHLPSPHAVCWASRCGSQGRCRNCSLCLQMQVGPCVVTNGSRLLPGRRCVANKWLESYRQQSRDWLTREIRSSATCDMSVCGSRRLLRPRSSASSWLAQSRAGCATAGELVPECRGPRRACSGALRYQESLERRGPRSAPPNGATSIPEQEKTGAAPAAR